MASFFLLLALLLGGVFWLRSYRDTAPLDLEQKSLLIDQAGLFSEQEYRVLDQLLQLMGERHGLCCVVLSTWDFDEYAPLDYVSRAWQQLFPDPKARGTALLLVVSPGFANPVALPEVFADSSSWNCFQDLQRALRQQGSYADYAEVTLTPPFASMTPEHGLCYLMAGSAYAPRDFMPRFQQTARAYAYPYLASGGYFEASLTTLAFALACVESGLPIEPLLQEAEATVEVSPDSTPIATQHARMPLARRVNQFLRHTPDWALSVHILVALLGLYFGSLALLMLLYLVLTLVHALRSPPTTPAAKCYLAQKLDKREVGIHQSWSRRLLRVLFAPHRWLWRMLRAVM